MDTEYKRIAGNLDNCHNLCCDDPEVKEILDLATGNVLTAQEAIGSDVDKAMILRRELAKQHNIDADDQLSLICPYCHKPLRLNCRLNGQRFYFAHIQRENNCPQLDKKNWSRERIQAAKYNGQKESIPHKMMKADLCSILKLDSRFSDISVEVVVKGVDPGSRRKPDVRALYKGHLRVVFEIQLSTTFLDVVLARRDFYRRNRELLVWVFKEFTLRGARMMEFDTFHANNMNAIVLDQEALRKCRQQKRLLLKCAWVEPRHEGGKLIHLEGCNILDFEEFNKSIERQQIFHFDYRAARSTVDADMEEYKALIDSQSLRDAFFKDFDPTLEADDQVNFVSHFFPDMNLLESNIKWKLNGYLRMMNAAKTGRPTIESSGWNFINFKNIYDNVYKSHKSLYFLFCCAMKAYSRNETSDSIRSRKKEAWSSICANGRKSKFHHDLIYDKLTEVLFPEVGKVYRDILSRATQSV